MNRRDFFKVFGSFLAGMIIPERHTMKIGNILEKLVNQQPISEQEKQQIVMWGNQTELVNSFVGGLQNGQSDVFSRTLNSMNFPITPIYSKNLEADAANIEIQIPSSYKHLLIFSSGRCTAAGSAIESFLARFNSDSGTNYETQVLYGIISSAGTQTSSITTSAIVGGLPQSSATAGKCGSGFVFLPNYNEGLYKTLLSLVNPGADANIFVQSGVWKSTSVVKSIVFSSSSGNLAQGLSLSVYGLR